MPELLARTDHDFVLSQERRPRRAGKKKPGRLAWARTLLRNPGSTVVGAAGAALAVGIVINALALQVAPHPAPLFGRAPAEAVRPAVPAVLPPARPVDLGAAPSIVPPAGETARVQKASAPGLAPATPANSARDPIGDILRTGTTGPAGATGLEPNRSVMAAQKALNKLGYGPMKADGLFGSGTRQAIERFERDRKLPQTGDLGVRTARELAAASGVSLD